MASIALSRLEAKVEFQSTTLDIARALPEPVLVAVLRPGIPRRSVRNLDTRKLATQGFQRRLSGSVVIEAGGNALDPVFPE